MSSGQCKLTGKKGKFVKSHLLPLALCRIGPKGEKATEATLDSARHVRRPPGWYDKSMVTLEGERILARIDDAGISELRRAGLVWSSSRNDEIVWKEFDHQTGAGFANVYFKNPRRVRMFVLSLLWRASVTTLPDFIHFKLSEDDEMRLRELLFSDDPGQNDEYITHAVMLKGEKFPHNHTPIREIFDYGGRTGEISRVYLDGLIFRISDKDSSNSALGLGEAFDIGFRKEATVFTMPSHSSRQVRDVMSVFENVAKMA